MTRMRIAKVLVLAALVGSGVSCGNLIRQGRSPVYLEIVSLGAAPGDAPTTFVSNLLSDVQVLRTSPAPCSVASPCPTIFNDVGQASIRAQVKNVLNPTGPTANNDVTINRIHIAYRRADGRNTPGVDVPYAWDGAATGTVSAGGTLSLGFEIVRHTAKLESPLVELVNSSKIIVTLADVTFYGRDQVGNEVSVTGTLQIDFGNFAD